jgi:hypothetical protein
MGEFSPVKWIFGTLGYARHEFPKGPKMIALGSTPLGNVVSS